MSTREEGERQTERETDRERETERERPLVRMPQHFKRKSGVSAVRYKHRPHRNICVVFCVLYCLIYDCFLLSCFARKFQSLFTEKFSDDGVTAFNSPVTMELWWNSYRYSVYQLQPNVGGIQIVIQSISHCRTLVEYIPLFSPSVTAERWWNTCFFFCFFFFFLPKRLCTEL